MHWGVLAVLPSSQDLWKLATLAHREAAASCCPSPGQPAKPSHSWWFMMIHDDSWWFMMINDDSWWFMMINDDSWWLMMIHDDSWWWRWWWFFDICLTYFWHIFDIVGINLGSLYNHFGIIFRHFLDPKLKFQKTIQNRLESYRALELSVLRWSRASQSPYMKNIFFNIYSLYIYIVYVYTIYTIGPNPGPGRARVGPGPGPMVYMVYMV